MLIHLLTCLNVQKIVGILLETLCYSRDNIRDLTKDVS